MNKKILLAELENHNGTVNDELTLLVRRPLGNSPTGRNKKRKYEAVDKNGDSIVMEVQDDDKENTKASFALKEGRSYKVQNFEIEEEFVQGEGLCKKIKLTKDAKVDETEEIQPEEKDQDVSIDSLTTIEKLPEIFSGLRVLVAGFVLRKQKEGTDPESPTTILVVGDHSKHCVEVQLAGSQEDAPEKDSFVCVDGVLEGQPEKRLGQAFCKNDPSSTLQNALKDRHGDYYETFLGTDDVEKGYANVSRVEIGELKNNKGKFTTLDIKSIEDVSNIKKLLPSAPAKGLRLSLPNVKFFVNPGTSRFWYDACPDELCRGKGLDKDTGLCKNCKEKPKQIAHKPLGKLAIYQGRYSVNVMLDKKALEGFFPGEEKTFAENLWELHKKEDGSYAERLRQAFPRDKAYEVTLLIKPRSYTANQKTVETVDVKVVECKPMEDDNMSVE